MTSRQAKIQEDTYFRIMRILQENPDLTQRELAEELGVSVGGLNYCLKALMEKGWVKVQNFSQSKNKFGYVYILTPRGIAEKAALTSRFLKRKMEEYELLKAETETLRKEVGDKAATEQRMGTKINLDGSRQYSVHEGVPPAAKALIWEVFFRSRGRGIDLSVHYPWIDQRDRVTSILISPDHGNEQATAAAALVIKEASLVAGRKIGLVGLVCVDEAFRGSGLGHKLVSAATEVARDKSFDTLVLWTGKPNVYVKHGFAVDSIDRYGKIWKHTADGVGRSFCHDPSGLKIDDISSLGIPAFANRVLVFSHDTASITVMPAAQGYTLAAWSGSWDTVFKIIERILPDTWSLNAPADSDIYAELEARGYSFDLPAGAQRMTNELSGKDFPGLPYIPLLNRI